MGRRVVFSAFPPLIQSVQAGETIIRTDESFSKKTSAHDGISDPRGMVWMAAAAFLPIAAALDNEENAMRPYHRQTNLPRIFVGVLAAAALFTGAPLRGAARALLGPSMGVTSVLWVMMRSDSAVKPGLSWTIFGIWSIIALTYLYVQSRRVSHEKLYILLSTAFAGIFMCIIALVQKSSMQGGLGTAIPPCMSFAAYAVALFFPDKKGGARWTALRQRSDIWSLRTPRFFDG